MPYTLTMFLLWGVLLAAVGVVVGWLLRSLTARAQAGQEPGAVDAGELERLRLAAADRDAIVAERDRLRIQVAELRGDDVRVAALPDASAVLGRPVDVDDLTVVEGIGPKISELCRAMGIDSWQALADTPVDRLRSMLDDAGSRYRVHDPSTWPRQAELLAAGRWDEYRAFVESTVDG